MQREYIVWCPEYDESIGNARRFVANGPDQAAMMWAENRDKRTEEPLIARGDHARVTVESIASGDQHDYFVTGEILPVYVAKLVVVPNEELNGAPKTGA